MALRQANALPQFLLGHCLCLPCRTNAGGYLVNSCSHLSAFAYTGIKIYGFAYHALGVSSRFICFCIYSSYLICNFIYRMANLQGYCRGLSPPASSRFGWNLVQAGRVATTWTKGDLHAAPLEPLMSAMLAAAVGTSSGGRTGGSRPTQAVPISGWERPFGPKAAMSIAKTQRPVFVIPDWRFPPQRRTLGRHKNVVAAFRRGRFARLTCELVELSCQSRIANWQCWPAKQAFDPASWLYKPAHALWQERCRGGRVRLPRPAQHLGPRE